MIENLSVSRFSGLYFDGYPFRIGSNVLFGRRLFLYHKILLRKQITLVIVIMSILDHIITVADPILHRYGRSERHQRGDLVLVINIHAVYPAVIVVPLALRSGNGRLSGLTQNDISGSEKHITRKQEDLVQIFRTRVIRICRGGGHRHYCRCGGGHHQDTDCLRLVKHTLNSL